MSGTVVLGAQSIYISEPETKMLDFTELLVGEIRYILIIEII